MTTNFVYGIIIDVNYYTKLIQIKILIPIRVRDAFNTWHLGEKLNVLRLESVVESSLRDYAKNHGVEVGKGWMFDVITLSWEFL